MNARVLVVDDDLTIAEVVGDYLRDAGLETRHAADGLSALSLAREWPPDMVVLDLMLPGIDGLEVCRRLQRPNPIWPRSTVAPARCASRAASTMAS